MYVLIDYFTDVQRQKGDFAGIILDPRHDFGDEPRSDDFMLNCQWNSDLEHVTGAVKWRGGSPQGLNWRDTIEVPSGSEVGSSDDASNNPVSRELHKMYEFRIPRNLLDYPSIGFLAFTGDAEMGTATSTWPAARSLKGNIFDDPSQWGELAFSSSPKQSTSMHTTMAGVESIPTPDGYLILLGIVAIAGMMIIGAVQLKRRRQLHSTPSQA